MDAVSRFGSHSQVQISSQPSEKAAGLSLEHTEANSVLTEGLTAEGVAMFAMQVIDQQQLNRIEGALNSAANYASEGLEDTELAGVIRQAAAEVVGVSNQAQTFTMFELIALIMAVSLRDGERQRDMAEELKPEVSATAIAIQAIGQQAIEDSFTSNILSSVGAMMNGVKAWVGTSDNKDATDAVGSISSMCGLHAASYNISSELRESIKAIAQDYMDKTKEQIDGALQMGDASQQELDQQLTQLVNTGNHMAMIIASATEIMKGAFRKS